MLLITLGSHGDVHPFIAISRELIARGHRATLATNPYFQAQVEAAGIRFAPLTEHQALKEIIEQHRVMDPLRGPLAVMRGLVLPMVPQFVDRTRALIREIRPDAVVYHPIVIGAAWACGLEGGVRTVSISPSPLLWSNPRDQMALIPMRSHTPRPREVRFDRFIGLLFMRILMDPGLNRVRRSLGLAARRDNFLADCTGADLNLGIWSPVLRGPLAGDPAHSVITGFCWHDRDHTQEAPDHQTDRFLDEGSPPIVFALGSTGVHAAGRFYESAVEASIRLGRRALLVIGRGQRPPANLPTDGSVLAVEYAPFSRIFPRAAAVVHHGGAGTTAQAMRAGRPTLITPMAHDQFDNAARIKRLGAGETLRFGKVTATRMADALGAVLGNPGHARAASALADRLRDEAGETAAAEHILRLRA